MSFEWSLKEHKRWADPLVPDITFLKSDATTIRARNWDTGGYPIGYGIAYIFAVIDRAWLDGKRLNWRWRGQDDQGAIRDIYQVLIYDGEYERDSVTDFPDGAAIPNKGNGLLQTLDINTDTFGWEEKNILINVAGGSEEKCTVMFLCVNAWTSKIWMDIDWVKVLENGSEECYEHFTDAVTMEVTGTYFDYGYISAGVCPYAPPPPPPTGHPKIELRFTNVDPPTKEPHRTIYRDLESLPDPMLLGITIRYFNYDSIPLFFRITAVAAGYTFGDVALGALASGTNAFINLDQFGSRAKPGAALTEYIAFVLTAYTDAGYTNLQWTYTRVCSVVIIDSTDGSWTTDENDNFDDATVQGWAATDEGGNMGGWPTVGVVNDFVLSAPWALMMTQRANNFPCSARLWKQFTTPDKNQVFAVVNWRLDREIVPGTGNKNLEFRRDAFVRVFSGRPQDNNSNNYLPWQDWKRTVFPLLRDTVLEVQIAHEWWAFSLPRDIFLWMDDFKIVSKD